MKRSLLLTLCAAATAFGAEAPTTGAYQLKVDDKAAALLRNDKPFAVLNVGNAVVLAQKADDETWVELGKLPAAKGVKHTITLPKSGAEPAPKLEITATGKKEEFLARVTLGNQSCDASLSYVGSVWVCVPHQHMATTAAQRRTLTAKHSCESWSAVDKSAVPAGLALKLMPLAEFEAKTGKQ